MASVISFLPFQDLNGYDHPWPQGGSKNLFDPWEKGYYSPSRDYFVGDSNNITSKPVYLTAGTVVTLSQTDNSKDYSFEEWSICPQSRLDFKSEFLLARISNVTSGASRTYTVQNDSYVTFRINYENSSIEEEKPQAEIGSEATEYVPYSNICPITAPVHLVGKNLFDPSKLLANSNYTIGNNGEITVNGGDQGAWVNKPTLALSAGTYTFSRSNGYGRMYMTTSTDNFATQQTVMNNDVTRKTITFATDVQLKFKVGNVADSYPFTVTVQLELGSEATTYEPYTETPVYGGYLDIGNGEVVEEWLCFKQKLSEAYRKITYSNCIVYFFRDTENAIIGENTQLCNIAPYLHEMQKGEIPHFYAIHNNTYNVYYVFMPLDVDESLEVQIVAPLATPVPHTLNSAQLAHIMAELNVRYSSMLESRRRILMSSPHVEKLSTETAFFKTDLKAPLKECKISFTPVQEGTGDPSPTNIRPINCWTKVNVGQTGKAIAEIVGYSAQNGGSIASTRNLSNAYGTTVSTVDFVAPHGEVTITQTEWPVPETPSSYRNGYFTIYVGNLVFGKSYAVSCRITNITSNPLNIELDNIVLQSPSGANGKEMIIEGDRITWRHIQWLPHSTAPARSNFEIRFCGMSFTMSDFMVTAEDEEDQTYEPYTDTDIVPVTFPYPTRNHLHLVGYSATTITSPKNARQLTNKYGTVLSTTNPDNSITITQEQWPNATNVYDFRNGYFIVVDDNLEFGKKYIVSFKVSNITNNPLNVNLTAMKIVSPSGSSITLTQDGDRLISSPFTYRQLASAPTQRGIDIRNCGMSLTISDIMVTEEDETDQTYVPFKSNFYGGYVDLVKGEIVAEWEAIDCLWKDYVNTATKDGYGITRHGFNFVNPVQGYGVTGESRDMFCNVAPKNYTDVYDKVHFYIAGTYSRAYVYLPTETDENTRIVIVARLKEPIHYPIDPVTIKTLKGINTIWNDANGSMDLSYWTH